MSEEKDEITKITPSELQPDQTALDNAPLISQIESRLVKAQSNQEAILWTQIRGEVIRQNEIVQDGHHRRFLNKFQVFRRTALSLAALTIGLLLVNRGFLTIGMFILGVGLYELAPGFIKMVWPTKDKGGNDDSS